MKLYFKNHKPYHQYSTCFFFGYHIDDKTEKKHINKFYGNRPEIIA